MSWRTHPASRISSPLLQTLGDRRMLAAYDGWSGLEGNPVPGQTGFTLIYDLIHEANPVCFNY